MLTSNTLPTADTLSMGILSKEMVLSRCLHEVRGTLPLVSFEYRSPLELLMFETPAGCQVRFTCSLQEFQWFFEMLQIERQPDPLIFSFCSPSQVFSFLVAWRLSWPWLHSPKTISSHASKYPKTASWFFSPPLLSSAPWFARDGWKLIVKIWQAFSWVWFSLIFLRQNLYQLPQLAWADISILWWSEVLIS